MGVRPQKVKQVLCFDFMPHQGSRFI